MEAALDALLGNVFDHTPEGTGYRVQLGVVGEAVELAVEDDGPGLPTDAVERGRSGAGSTGLGLDIVRRTAATAGGELRLERGPSDGARVVLRLPVLREA